MQMPAEVPANRHGDIGPSGVSRLGLTSYAKRTGQPMALGNRASPGPRYLSTHGTLRDLAENPGPPWPAPLCSPRSRPGGCRPRNSSAAVHKSAPEELNQAETRGIRSAAIQTDAQPKKRKDIHGCPRHCRPGTKPLSSGRRLLTPAPPNPGGAASCFLQSVSLGRGAAVSLKFSLAASFWMPPSVKFGPGGALDASFARAQRALWARSEGVISCWCSRLGMRE